MIKIPEYWIADAKKQRLRMLFHTESGYEEIDLKPGDKICSRQFPQLMLTLDEILSPPIIEDLIKAEQAHLQALEQQHGSRSPPSPKKRNLKNYKVKCGI